MFDILILSLIQGITEFIPVSSSSHLILLSDLTNFDNKSLSIDVSLHLGSFIAVSLYFRRDIYDFINNKKLFYKIIISSLPVMIIGYYLVQTNLIERLRNTEIIGWTTLTFGIILYISDKFNLKKNIKGDFNYKSAIFIGFFQVMSLIPGVSRSGIAITAARILRFKRYDAAKISFLLSIPTLGAVSIFGFQNLITSNNLQLTLLNILSIILSATFSYITIKFFLSYIKKFSLNIFVYYRVVLGLILIFSSTFIE